MLLISLLSLLFVFVIVGVGIYRKMALHYELLDHPNHRSSHQVPTPRGAGIVLILFWYLFLIVLCQFKFFSFQQIALFFPALLITLFGFLDDYYSISAKLRFLIQLIAALLTLYIMGGVSEWILGVWHLHSGVFLGSALACLMLLWSTNLFNFMDGIDGMTGVEALFVLLPSAYWLWFQGGYTLSLALSALAVSVLGFLIWNWPKAKVFMGDSGSTTLGFLIMLFALVAQQSMQISLLSWLVLYGLFLFDASITLLRRIIAGEKWYQAHRSHAYQRLHQGGWSHRKIIGGVILLNLVLAALATWMNFNPSYSLWGFLTALGLMTLSYVYVDKVYPS